jgi:CheY-specific phosphatase CheX
VSAGTLEPAALGQIIARTLEDVAFMFAFPATDADAAPGVGTRATLAFDGPGPGRVHVHASEGLGVTLAAGMMGLDESDPEAQSAADAAVGELTNILTGQIVTHLYGSELCALGTPNVTADAPAPEPDAATCASIAMTIDDAHRLDVWVHLDP